MADDVSFFFSLTSPKTKHAKHIDLNPMTISTGWNWSNVEWQHGNLEQKAKRPQSLANNSKWQNCDKGRKAKLPCQS